MVKCSQSVFLAGMAGMLWIAMTVPAACDENPRPFWEPEPIPPSYTQKSIRKLSRGLANIVTCPLEILRTTALTEREDGMISGTTSGLLNGPWRVIVRGVVGVVEVATFPIDTTSDFKPMVQPEFVWTDLDWSS